MKSCRMCFDGSMVSSLEVHPYQWTTYLRKGLDRMYRTLWLTVFSRSSAVGIFKRLCLLDCGIGTSEAECACGRVRIWRGRDKGVNVSIVVGWDTQSMNTALGIPYLSVVTG